MILCVKCKEAPACIDIKFALYCSPCFLEATFHKYRILLGRNREDNISISSSATSTNTTTFILLPKNFTSSPTVLRACRVLIHFSQLPGIQEPARKNLINYELVVPISTNEKEREMVNTFIEMIKLEYPLMKKVHLIETYNLVTNTGWLSTTHREDVLNLKLLHAQLKLMSASSVHKALTPETSTSLASYILACTCKGRGKFLPWDSALNRAFPNGSVLTRPLKEISDKEIDLYCQEAKFNFDHLITSSDNTNMSIDQLTVNFMKNLETENPGTSNVVIRTSAKVSTSTSTSTSTSCPICFAPNDGICEACEPIHFHFDFIK